jgi:hypothetical protein
MISTKAGCPSTGLFGSTWISRPVAPNDARVWGIMNLNGVIRCGCAGSVTKFRKSTASAETTYVGFPLKQLYNGYIKFKQGPLQYSAHHRSVQFHKIVMNLRLHMQSSMQTNKLCSLIPERTELYSVYHNASLNVKILPQKKNFHIPRGDHWASIHIKYSVLMQVQLQDHSRGLL